MAYGDKYYRVVEPTSCWVNLGWIKGGSTVNGTQVGESVYVHVDIKPGAEIHAIMDGAYIVQDGCLARPIKFHAPYQPEPLCKTYDRSPAVPGNLVGSVMLEIPAAAAKKPANGYVREGVEFADGTPGVVPIASAAPGNVAKRLIDQAAVEEFADDIYDQVNWNEEPEAPAAVPGR